MKREEFFEALSDIDENLIAKAEPQEEAAEPITVTPKRSYFKTICAAAACTALIAALVTVVAINANRLPSVVGSGETPHYVQAFPMDKNYTYINIVSKSTYPETVYPYTGDFSNLEIQYMGDVYTYYPNDSKYRSYDELAADSSLIVMGTFIDDTCQGTDYYDAPDFHEATIASYFNPYLSFNTLKVEKVLKSNGKVWEGDEIVISQDYVTADGGMYSFSQLTPMIKGDSWIYFLTQRNEYHEEIHGKGTYYAVNDYEGRYPVPDNENAPFEYRENTKGVVAPAVFNESIYRELKEKLEGAVESKRPPYIIESKKVTGIAKELEFDYGYSSNTAVEFEMGEFDGTVFGIEEGELYVRTSNALEERHCTIGGPGCYVQLGSTYLCDLSGDGKREICTEISLGSGIVNNFIWVLDYANDDVYILDDRGNYDYFLRERNGELEYSQKEFNVNWTVRPDDESSWDILTLDVMTKCGDFLYGSEGETTQEPESSPKNVIRIMELMFSSDSTLADMPLEFDTEDFPNVMFLRDTNAAFGDTLYAIEGENSFPIFECRRITSIYLCDLNGDGKREICAGICLSPRDGSSDLLGRSIAVIDYANCGAYLLSEEESYDYLLGVKDDTLYFQRFDAKTGEELAFEPLTLNIMDDHIRVGERVQFIFIPNENN